MRSLVCLANATELHDVACSAITDLVMPRYAMHAKHQHTVPVREETAQTCLHSCITVRYSAKKPRVCQMPPCSKACCSLNCGHGVRSGPSVRVRSSRGLQTFFEHFDARIIYLQRPVWHTELAQQLDEGLHYR